MTLNQVLRRIKSVALTHKQVRDYRQGLVTDFFADSTAKYPAVLVQDNGGSISLGGKVTTVNYRLYFVDLVNVSADAKGNIDDVQSDMISIAMDLLAVFNGPLFTDWRMGSDSALQLFDEGENDLYAGCYVDIAIGFPFTQNTCQIPMDTIAGSPTDTDMKVYDLTYNAVAAEGATLTITALAGKKILLITRENNIIYKASNAPSSSEFTWDGTAIGLGTAVGDDGERFLILYRNY